MINLIRTKQFRGFTLTEALLYIAIVSIILTAIVSFYAVVMNTDDRNKVVSALDQNGLQITEYITRSIRNSNSVTVPEIGNTSTVLILATDEVDSELVLELSNGILIATEGEKSFELSSNRFLASELSFKNLTSEGTKSTIKFQFKLSNINPDNIKSSDYSQIFYGSATLR